MRKFATLSVLLLIVALFSTHSPVVSTANPNATPHYTVVLRAVTLYGDPVPPSEVSLTLSDEYRVLYSGPLPGDGEIHLSRGVYSFSLYDAKVGYNAQVIPISADMVISIPLSPVQGRVIDTKTGKIIDTPTDSYFILQLNEERSGLKLPHADYGIPSSHVLLTPLSSPPLDTCHHYWVLWKEVDLGIVNELQGAVYSYYINSSYYVTNQPTVTQYTQQYEEISYGGGPVSRGVAQSYGISITTPLPLASYYTERSYDVYIQAHWYDDIYKIYNECSGQFTGPDTEVFLVKQWSNWYDHNSPAVSTNNYNFQCWGLIAVGNLSSQQIYITYSQWGSQTTSISAMATISVSKDSTGGEYSGSFNVGGVTSLNSQTAGWTVVYTLTAYGRCAGYSVYQAGWVLGFGPSSKSC